MRSQFSRFALQSGSFVALAAMLLPFAAERARAANFTISSASTTTQTLNAGQTGLITSTGSLTVSGSSNAVSFGGGAGATLTNLGTLSQTGTGRAIRDNSGSTGLVVTNGSTSNSSARILAHDADVFQMNVATGSVTLNNYGLMQSTNASVGGAQVVDFNALTNGATNVVNNYGTGQMLANDADAVRPGVNGVVNNAGLIKSIIFTPTGANNGAGSDGVDAQNNTGIQVLNGTGVLLDGSSSPLYTGTIEGGRHGITGGPANGTTPWTISITNGAAGHTGATLQGDNGSGINIDGFNANQTATVLNYGTIKGTGVTGDGDGVDVDGLVALTNYGTILSANAFSNDSSNPAHSEGVTVGGGTIINSGTIQGSTNTLNGNIAVGFGITVLGLDDPNGVGNPPRGAIFGNTTITNLSGGLIKGDSESGILVGGAKSGFSVVINNDADATVQGGGLTSGAITTGLDDDVINEAGTINGASSNLAIDMGGGNNTLNITGGQASITGNIDGGAGGSNLMKVDAGNGNSFSYGGSILDFTTVDLASGTTVLSGASTYTGTTEVDTGATLDLDGVNRLASASGLDLNGGTVELTDTDGANGESLGCLSLTDNSTLDLDESSITFGCLETVTSGKIFTVEDYSSTISPDFAVRFAGDLSGDANFLALLADTTIDGKNATYQVVSGFTDLVAAPEPSTFGLVLLGGVVAFAIRRRRA